MRLLRLLLFGRLEGPATHVRVRSLFLSGLGVVYFCAFLSLWVQIHGLIGSTGILPIRATLDWMEQQQRGFFRFPTLLWIDSSDVALHLLCGGGVVLSLAVIAGFARLPCLVLLWVFYLSLFTAGLVFTSFQWDTLLLESGFLAIFLAPWNWTPWGARGREASLLALFAQRYLLFRLMFASGVVKLTAKDPSWPDLTALTYHYETQPLPTWTSWHVHHLPLWFHKLSCRGMFFAELVVPFLVFLPRMPRLLAFACFAGLQLTIAATGNYGFFNLLTLLLSITLLDDRMLPWKGREPVTASPTWPPLSWARRVALAPLLLLATGEFLPALDWPAAWPRPARWTWQKCGLEWVALRVDRLRLVSTYGLFRTMTKKRWEIVVEGSADGQEWKPYVFKWKPGDLDRAPAFTGPHMPRLDWQMWFAALTPSYEDAWWFTPFLQRLLENEPSVVALLERNPFPDEPPRYIQATRHVYEFTTPEERRRNGAWWKRDEGEPYTPRLWLR